MKKNIIFLVGAFVLVVIITLGVNSNKQEGAAPADTTPVGATKIPEYTLAQVSVHSGAASCWSIVRTNVYDLTSWINKHPGGASAILGICGKDGTILFEGQHGGQKRPENELAGFEIGVYKK